MKNLRSIHDTLNVKIQERFIYWGVHYILDADDTAAITEEILALFSSLIEEEAKGMEIKTSGKGWIDSTNWSGYREAISDYKSRLIEAVKG